MDEMFATWKMVLPDVEIDEIKLPEKKFDKFLLLTKDFFDSRKHTQTTTTTTKSDDLDWFTNHSVNDVSTVNFDNNKYESMSLDDILNLTGLNKYVKITSGYRDKNIGKAGNKSNHRKKDNYGNPMAYDIIPIGESFDQMYSRLSNNEDFMAWMQTHKFNINDETSRETLRKTGGTGAHFHIGQDSFNVRKGEEGFNTDDLHLNVFTTITPKKVQLNPPTVKEIQTMPIKLNIPTHETTDENPETKEEESQNWFTDTSVLDLNVDIEDSDDDKKKITIPSNFIQNTSFESDFQKYGTSEVFTKNKDFWTKLAFLESRFNPNIQNNKSKAYGYFQLMDFNRTGTDVQSLFKDAEAYYLKCKKSITDTDRKLAAEKGITENGIIAGMWLGGPTGVKKALRGQGNAADANGTTVLGRMKQFS